MKIQKTKQIALIFAVIAAILFIGLAFEGKAGIALFNNTSQKEIVSNSEEPITYIISNLTRPAEVEITEEDIQRIPKVEGTVQSNGIGNSSEYEEVILSTFLQATDQFSGAGKGMDSYNIKTFDLLTDPDFADPLFLSREKGVKVTIAINSSPGVLENTYWGYLTDASVIAHKIYHSTAGPNTGYLTVSYINEGRESPKLQVSLTAKDAKAFSDQWTENTYLPLTVWSAATIDSSAGIVPYENIDTAIPAPEGIKSLSSDTASTSGITDEYNLYVSKNDLKELLGSYSIEMQDHIQTISSYSTKSDFQGMADASKEMISRATEIEEEIAQLPINPKFIDAADDFLEGLRNYRYAGTYFWYGATFTETEPVETGNNYVQQGFLNNNDALEALDMETIENEMLELPNGNLFPDAKYLYENYEYQDSNQRNDISVKLSALTCTNMYVLSQDGEKEKNLAGYGYMYIFPVIEVHHLGYRGSGSSRITIPDTDDFSVIYNGEEYSDITPSPYVGRTLDTATYVDPAGHPYYKMTLDRKEEFEGILVFKVPQDFDREKAYLALDLGDEKVIWHMTPR
ncbi:hypothetical protein [Methanogenium organophilum]|uniref:Uncharacterized protein n=1 Tax=Methanogenium organophilum TaxID=2199 RepID=A0A9X9S4Z1_METOG|nr:hypothetical protein [Methanogenium organophilum]WAI01626.1 hypothetical protein OU421_01785 [Methanogenium organophilum]